MNTNILHSDHAHDAHNIIQEAIPNYKRPDPHTVAYKIAETMLGPWCLYDAYGVTIAYRCRAESCDRQYILSDTDGQYDTRYVFVDNSAIVISYTGKLWWVE